MITHQTFSTSWNNLPNDTRYAIEKAHRQGTLAPGSLHIMRYGSSDSTNYDAATITGSSGQAPCYYNAIEGIR